MSDANIPSLGFLEMTVDKFIFKVATDRLYSPEGVWVLEENGGNRVRLGITDYQQQLNGDMAFVHLKPVGTNLGQGDEFAEIETIKATTGFPSPVAGTVVECNSGLQSTPEAVNQEPYGNGWFAILETADWQTDRARLLSAEAYLAAIRKQAEEELA
jgi:glycine cleavage system H protein